VKRRRFCEKKKEDKLRDAIKEYNRLQMNQVLERGEYDPEFTSKIVALAKQHQNQRKSKGLSFFSRSSILAKRVASILLIGALSSGFLFAASPSARAAFFAWVREVSETIATYRAETNEELPVSGFQLPTWIPQGFFIASQTEYSDLLYILYEDSDGNSFTFSHYVNPDSVNLSINREHADLIPLHINEIVGDLYLERRPNHASTLVWTQDQNFFVIHGTLSQEDFLQIAESVS